MGPQNRSWSLVVVASLAYGCSSLPPQRQPLAEAEEALARGRDKVVRSEYLAASAACLRGVEAIGNGYLDPRVVDDTGQRLVLATTLPPEGAARVRCETLAIRVSLMKAKIQ